jgi:hypothetical protein
MRQNVFDATTKTKMARVGRQMVTGFPTEPALSAEHTLEPLRTFILVFCAMNTANK